MIWWPDKVPTLVGTDSNSGTPVTLRPINPRDTEDIFRACQDPLIPKFTTVPSIYPLELAISFAGKMAEVRHENKNELIFVIESQTLVGRQFHPILKDGSLGLPQSSNGFAGVISLHTIDMPNHRAEIGYWLASEARGKGIGTIAAELITEYGLITMGFRRIEALVVVDNEPSKKLLLNAGFQFEGLLKQYSTRSDGSQVDMALFAATK